MNEQEIINEIKNYMKNPLKAALLLEGEWGCGKTYFVQNKLKKIDTIYISLYGINSLSNLTFQVICQITGGQLLQTENKQLNKLFEKAKKTKKKVNSKVVNTASSMLVSYVESKITIPIQSIVEMLSGINLQKKLIVLDDLERSTIPINDILGFINTLVEHNSIKVLLIANEDEIKSKNEYLKTKEKLIYQTIKYKPDFENVILELLKEENETIKKNKDYVIKEMVDEKHYNIRTLQFIIQRYKELEKYLEKVFKTIKNEENISKIKDDLFKYFVIAAINYKEGNDLPYIDNDSDMSIYEGTKGSSQSIPSFKLVNDFISGVPIVFEHVVSVLTIYSSQLILANAKEDIPMDILGNWWEKDDDEICEKTNKLLGALHSNLLDVNLYIKILIYLSNIQVCGFEGFLDEGFSYMKKNIESSTKAISLEVKFENWIDDEAKPIYQAKRNELETIINKHNEMIKENEFLDCLKQEKGKIGSSLYDYCIKKRDSITESVGLIKTVGIENIMDVIKNGASVDIRYMIYLFYDFNKNVVNRVTERESLGLYDSLLKKVSKVDSKDFSTMKKYNIKRFKKCLKDVIEGIKEQ